MRIFRFILLILLTLVCIAAAVLLTIDGNLSRVLGRSSFTPGERLFPYTREQINEVSWMRINCVGEIAEVSRKPNGVWWCTRPWDDRMDPRAAAAILQFTASTSIVDSLPIRKIDSTSIKEFGVKTAPVTLTLKKRNANGGGDSTIARYTLGSKAPWLVDDIENKVTNDTTYMQTDFYGRNTDILVGTGNIMPLFKAGIRQLRDHRPLLIHPSMPAVMEINNKGKRILLQRDTPTAPWQITYPLHLQTDAEVMNVLLGSLQKLTAIRVYDPEESGVPDMNDEQLTSITIKNFTATNVDGKTILGTEDKGVTLRIYPPSDTTNPKEHLKATVSDRRAVFELAQLPEAYGEKDNKDEVLPGVRNLPLELNQLRSKQLTDIGDYKITGLSIRKGLQDFPIIARFAAGDETGATKGTWLYTADGSRYQPVNPDHLVSLLKTVKQGKVAGFVTDNPTDLAIYGLDNPLITLTMSLLPKPNEAPRSPVIVFFARGADDSWYAQQAGSPTVVMLDNEYMKGFLAGSLAWKRRNLFNFSRFDLKEMHLERVGFGGPLILKYDKLDDSWTATKDGKDETLNINPNRANRYLNALESLETVAWLPIEDVNAHRALATPVFRLTLVLQEYKSSAPDELKPDSTGLTFAPTEETIEKRITLEIAPAGEAGYSRFYYGKISGTPHYFILNMDSVRLLGASLAEDN